MCGISGFVGKTESAEMKSRLVGAMCDVMTHRGPDEAGYFVKGDVALGMRRLKIIDLSSGSQPIYNEDRSVVVVFNGEIYNFQKLRSDLSKKGHVFYTETDTEVIVHLYEEYGEGLLEYLNGMFAFAVWDLKKKKLFLARDRMGEKPLYYAEMEGIFLFASEIKSMLCHPVFKKELEEKAISYYFSLNYIPSPYTIYRNVFKLFPGEYLVLQHGTSKRTFYWNKKFDVPTKMSQVDIEEKIRHELEEAVNLRLVSDVPLGAFLSGGIDSSIMVALMSQISNTTIKTFSIGLENEEKSELPFARAVAKRYGTDHHELIAKPNALNLINQIQYHFDEPFGDSSAIPTFLVSQLTKNYVTVAISGDGGDELFGGYDRYRRIINRQMSGGGSKKMMRPFSRLIGDALPFGFKGKAFLQSLQYDDYEYFSVGTRDALQKELFSMNFLRSLGRLPSHSLAKSLRLKDQGLLNQCMFFDMKVYLPEDILVKVDRMSMANSLETRAPFLDHHLVEFALTIPANLKLFRGETKYILKKAFRDRLPEGVFSHKKTGFSIPLGDWYRKELKPLILDTLSEKRIAQSGILNPAFVSKMISQHMSGRRNHKRVLWMILMFQLWYESWFLSTPPQVKSALSNRDLM